MINQQTSSTQQQHATLTLHSLVVQDRADQDDYVVLLVGVEEHPVAGVEEHPEHGPVLPHLGGHDVSAEIWESGPQVPAGLWLTIVTAISPGIWSNGRQVWTVNITQAAAGNWLNHNWLL